MPTVEIQESDFICDDIVSSMCQGRTDVGAIVTFQGLVRDLPEQHIHSMTLEHYPAMTQKALAGIVDEAMLRWAVLDITVIHRVGKLLPGDRIVLVAVISKHRHDAFQACEFVMDYLKTRAPFWKKERTEEGEHWVAVKDSDADADKRWD